MKLEALEILGLVPARGGSKGIPGKNLRLLAGKSLVARAVESGLQSRLLTRLVLSTDSSAIAEEGKKTGADVPFLRPPGLAQDQTPTSDVVLHALRWLEENEAYRPDILVLLQPTAPLRQGRHIDEALTLLVNSKARSVISVTPVPGHYSPCWQFLVRDGNLCPFVDSVTVPPRRQELPSTYTRNGAIYAARTEEWSTGSLSYGGGCLPYIMPMEDSANIDSTEDLALAEFLLARRETRP